jgi:LPXTG-motif cell wall-anchored protein
MQITDNTVTSSSFFFESLPKGFELQTQAFLLALLGILLSVFAIWYFKRRRSQFEVAKEKRHILSKHAKINLGLWIAFLIFWFFRTQQTQFLSMRMFMYGLGIASAINIVVAVVLAALKQPEIIETVETTTAEEYQKYLPKKKK